VKVYCEHRDGELWVKPIGTLDAAGARALRLRTEELDLGDDTTVAVDLSDVPFIDSSGLGVLIALAKRAARSAGRLRLVQPGEQPLRLVKLTRLDRFFEIATEHPA